jgi:hypothetical protein
MDSKTRSNLKRKALDAANSFLNTLDEDLEDAEIMPTSKRQRSNPLPVPTKVDGLDIVLNDEQQQAVEYVLKGESVFITGRSGTGKTCIIPFIVKALSDVGDQVAVTSTRSTQAVYLSGRTVHSFSGLSRVDEDMDVVRQRAKLKAMKDIWSSVNVVIIDDFHRMEPDVFLKIILCSQNSRPNKMHDIQWVFIGDFFQQPPMGTQRLDDDVKKEKEEFAFELPDWPKVIHRTVVLQADQRHKGDPTWDEVLRYVRWGNLQMVKQAHLNRRVSTSTAPSRDLEWETRSSPTTYLPLKRMPFRKLRVLYKRIRLWRERNIRLCSFWKEMHLFQASCC